MVTETQQIKIVDFGMARKTSLQDSRYNTARELGSILSAGGTRGYTPPEVEELLGDTLRDEAQKQVVLQTLSDPHIDQFAAGVILYELLAGCPPFDPNNLLQQATADHYPLEKFRPDLPARFRSAVERLKAVNREERYLSMREGLHRLLETLPG